jgi:hypothetical protein
MTETGTDAELVKVWTAGCTEQLTVTGAPEQDSVTVSLVVGDGAKIREYSAAVPAATVCVVDDPCAGASRNSLPEPERETDCGLLMPSSVMARCVWLMPEEEGV